MTNYQIKLINPSADILLPFIKELNPNLSEQDFRKYLKETKMNFLTIMPIIQLRYYQY